MGIREPYGVGKREFIRTFAGLAFGIGTGATSGQSLGAKLEKSSGAVPASRKHRNTGIALGGAVGTMAGGAIGLHFDNADHMKKVAKAFLSSAYNGNKPNLVPYDPKRAKLDELSLKNFLDFFHHKAASENIPEALKAIINEVFAAAAISGNVDAVYDLASPETEGGHGHFWNISTKVGQETLTVVKLMADLIKDYQSAYLLQEAYNTDAQNPELRLQLARVKATISDLANTPVDDIPASYAAYILKKHGSQHVTVSKRDTGGKILEATITRKNLYTGKGDMTYNVNVRGLAQVLDSLSQCMKTGGEGGTIAMPPRGTLVQR